MLNNVPVDTVEKAFIQRYPNAAKIPLLDTDYEIPSMDYISKLYKGFWRWMNLSKLAGWQFNKMDCDKRARAFQTYCFFIQAKKKHSIHSIPVAVINYYIGGEKGRGHSINSIYMGGNMILELDVAKKINTTTLNQVELDSVWLYLL